MTASALVAPNPAQNLVSRFPGATILVIDDIPELRQQIARALRGVYSSVLEAGSAQEARELLATHKVDAISCDLVMPVEDGVAFLRDIASNIPLNELPALIINTASLTHEGTHDLLVYQLEEAVRGRNQAIGFVNKFQDPADLITTLDDKIAQAREREAEHISAELELISLGSLAKRKTEVITDEFAQVARAGLADIEKIMTELAQHSEFYESRWSQQDIGRYLEKLRELSTIQRSNLSGDFPASTKTNMHSFENKLVAIIPPKDSDFTCEERASFSPEVQEGLLKLRTSYKQLLERLAEIKMRYVSFISDDLDPSSLIASLRIDKDRIRCQVSDDDLVFCDKDKLARTLLTKILLAMHSDSRLSTESSICIDCVSAANCGDSQALRAAQRLNWQDMVCVEFYFYKRDQLQIKEFFKDLIPDLSDTFCFFTRHEDDHSFKFSIYFKKSVAQAESLPASETSAASNLDLSKLKDFKPTVYKDKDGTVVCLDFSFDSLENDIAGFYGGRVCAYQLEDGTLLLASGERHAEGAYDISRAILQLQGEELAPYLIRHNAIRIFDEGVRVDCNFRRDRIQIENRSNACTRRVFALFAELAPDFQVSYGGDMNPREEGSTFFG